MYQLEQVCDQLVDCVKVAADSLIPGKSHGKRPRIAGWSQFVKPELQVSQWWHKLWIPVPIWLVFHFRSKSSVIGKYAV